jgi:hypothetical protein
LFFQLKGKALNETIKAIVIKIMETVKNEEAIKTIKFIMEIFIFISYKFNVFNFM